MSEKLRAMLRKYTVEEILEAIDFEDIAFYINENYPDGFDAFCNDFSEGFMDE